MQHDIFGVIRFTRCSLSIVTLLAVLFVASNAFAAGSFSEPRISFRYANATTLKITEPEGFRVTIAAVDGEKSGTIPEVFSLADKDDFVKVTITAPDGTAWTKKVEIQVKKQTELAVSFKPDVAKAEPSAARSYLGQLTNRTDGCGHRYAGEIRADFLAASDGSKAKTVAVAAGRNANVEVPSGSYDVRIFQAVRGEWQFVLSGRQELSKDGWRLTFGCSDRKGAATLLAQ